MRLSKNLAFLILLMIFKSTINEYNITIINNEINIVIVVIIPNLNNGRTEEKVKLRNPIAVVRDVINTGTPILRSCTLKYLNLFVYNLSELSKCIKSETVIIKTIAGIRIITNSIPPNNILDILNEITNDMQTEIKLIMTSFIFFK
tara:strand:- start:300 stop:737 length:438 start_codon:yes stop_codon:yes gene_type:complete